MLDAKNRQDYYTFFDVDTYFHLLSKVDLFITRSTDVSCARLCTRILVRVLEIWKDHNEMLLGLEQYLGIDPDLLELLSLQGSSSQVLECPTSDTEEEHEEVVQGSTCKDDYHDHQCQSQQQMKLQDKETLKSFHDENKRLRKYEEEKMDPKTPEDKGEMDILKAKTSFQAEFDNGRPGLLFLLSGKQQNAKSRRKRKTTKATSGKCDSVVSEASEAETSFDSAEF